jgi:Protein of unknown function (DUF1499).
MTRVLVWILGGLVALALAGTAAMAIWARVAPEDPAAWHVDPMTAERAGSPNTALVAPEGAAARADRAAPVWDASPEAVMAAFDAAARAQPRVERIAGGVEGLHATYRQRSATMGWPDYVSVRALPAEGGATLAIYSRSRFGESDFGVNAARVEAWLALTDERLR